jgi:hypothetical protein
VCAESQSRIDEFAALVHPRNGHRQIFAMMEAYLDESGIHDGAVACVVAGYFGQRNHWRHFEAAWIAVLTRFGFRLEDFHAKNWIKTRAKRPMLMELAQTIEKYAIYPVSMGIVIEGFNSFTYQQRRWLTGATAHSGKLVTSGCPTKPYFVPFQLCLMRVASYVKPGRKAHFSFGLDRNFADYAGALFRQSKIKLKNAPGTEWKYKNQLGSIFFPMASETPELQAADLLAYLTYLHLTGRFKTGRGPSKPTGLLELCLRNTRSPDDHGFLDKAGLEYALAVAIAKWGAGPSA